MAKRARARTGIGVRLQPGLSKRWAKAKVYIHDDLLGASFEDGGGVCEDGARTSGVCV